MNEMSYFERILSLINNIVASIILPIIQFPLLIILQIYVTLDNMIGGIINAIDIFNGEETE